MGQNKSVRPPAMTHLEGRSPTSADFLPKMYNLSLIVREHQTNPN